MTHSACNVAQTISAELCQQLLRHSDPSASRAGAGTDAPYHYSPDNVLPPRCSSKVTSPPREEFIGLGFSQTDMTGTQCIAFHPICLRVCCQPPWLGPRLPLQHPVARVEGKLY